MILGPGLPQLLRQDLVLALQKRRPDGHLILLRTSGVTASFRGQVVFTSPLPVLVVLALHRHVRLLSALPARNGEKTVSQSKCGHQVKVQLYNVHFEVRMKEETSFAL